MKEGLGLAVWYFYDCRVTHMRKTACLGHLLSALWAYELSGPASGRRGAAGSMTVRTAIMPHPRDFGSKHPFVFSTFFYPGPIFSKTKMLTLSTSGCHLLGTSGGWPAHTANPIIFWQRGGSVKARG